MADDQAARRAFWAQKMKEAGAFVQAIQKLPVAECGETFGDLRKAAADADVEVMFSDTLNGGRVPRVYQLREGLIEHFVGAARDMNQRGWVMKVEDGYRTCEMQMYLARTPSLFSAILDRVLWELGGETPTAEFMAERVGALIAGNPKVGTHMSCSAIDISVFDRATGKEIDRGAPYLEMSELTPMDSPFVSEAARANRYAICDVMVAHGFVAYPWEFWHFNQGDIHDAYFNKRTAPAKYGPVDWDPATNRVTAVADPLAPLNSAAEIQQQIEAALARLK